MSDSSNSPFQRSWMRLSEALSEVMSVPLAKGDAKHLICTAIAHRRINIELELRRHATRGMTARGIQFAGSDVNIPVELEPHELDFENSRPLEPWLVQRDRLPSLAGYWEIDWIELDRADVIKLMKLARGNIKEAPSGRRKKLRRRSMARAVPIKHFIQIAIPIRWNGRITTCARRWPKKSKNSDCLRFPTITILRAAGRRK